MSCQSKVTGSRHFHLSHLDLFIISTLRIGDALFSVACISNFVCYQGKQLRLSKGARRHGKRGHLLSLENVQG